LSTFVFIERATLELSLRDRIAAWVYTGPIGRLLALALDLGSLFVVALAYWLERLSRRLRRSR
jgi:hypothetical protein